MSEKKLTIKNLTGAGYKQFKSAHNLSDCGYQKRITNGGTTLYFINVYYYPDLYGAGQHGFMPDAQLYLDRYHDKWVDVRLGGFKTIEQVERFYKTLHLNMQCANYDYEK